MVDAFEVFRPQQLLFTKLDETGTFGPIFNEAARTGKPLSFFTTGQRIPEDLEAASPSGCWNWCSRRRARGRIGRIEPSMSGSYVRLYGVWRNTEDERERLILEHLPQVRLIARRIQERLPENISLDDLISTGVLGLISAIDNFDPAHNVKLKTYAEYKIRGAILDSLRGLDWAPRQKRRQVQTDRGGDRRRGAALAAHRRPRKKSRRNWISRSTSTTNGWWRSAG